ncbi:hypothetical protein RRG08_035471 [Elysia crispata]|uniref:Uncharacterized protein n=1 Tax=Elysia crispata TaxID=231223 RepID=A0AAE1ARG9_9GAST|nr:hypothetical protein RRG08_035471 [Elysia crispata]
MIDVVLNKRDVRDSWGSGDFSHKLKDEENIMHFVEGKPTLENPDPIQALVTAEPSSARKRNICKESVHPATPKMLKTETAKIFLSLKETISPEVPNKPGVTCPSSDEPLILKSTSKIDMLDEEENDGQTPQPTPKTGGPNAVKNFFMNLRPIKKTTTVP